VQAQKSSKLVEMFVLNEIDSTAKGVIQYLIPPSLAYRQNIIDIVFNPEPDTILKQKGKQFAQWHYQNLKIGDTVSIVTILETYNFDLSSAQNTNQDLSNNRILSQSNDGNDYQKLNTKSKALVDSLAQSLLDTITLKTVENIFNYVVASLDYKTMQKDEGGLETALIHKHGDCTEYTQLMMAYCGALDIDSRFVNGKVLQQNSSVNFHNWVEVYLDEWGWIPFDPTFADTGENHTTFDKLQNMYVYVDYAESFQYIYNSTGVKIDYYIFHLGQDDAAFDAAIQLYNTHQYSQAHLAFDALLANPSDRTAALKMFKGMLYARENKFDEGLLFLQESLEISSKTELGSVHYALGNYYALKNETELALIHLKKARDNGFDLTQTFLLDDIDLINLRDKEIFKKFILELK